MERASVGVKVNEGRECMGKGEDKGRKEGGGKEGIIMCGSRKGGCGCDSVRMSVRGEGKKRGKGKERINVCVCVCVRACVRARVQEVKKDICLSVAFSPFPRAISWR